MSLTLLAAAILIAAASVVACDRMTPTSPTAPASEPLSESSGAPAVLAPAAIAAPNVVFAGAGDIAECGSDGAERTARLLDRLPGFVFSLGDNAYPASTPESLINCYEPSWGRHRGRTYTVPGNHDWEVQAGAPYFAYFGSGAGPAGRGYYSADLGAWRVLSLNSNVAAHPGTAQYEWVRKELATPGGACTLVLWHHPVFSSGQYGNNPHMQHVWRLLDAAGVDVVLTGHEHSYERFAPQDADGRPDALGIRQFVVGTGGAQRRAFGAIQPNSEVRNSDAWGVLKLVLSSASYDWEFIPAAGQLFSDQGTGQCVR
jgi:hypothetical protein